MTFPGIIIGSLTVVLLATSLVVAQDPWAPPGSGTTNATPAADPWGKPQASVAPASRTSVTVESALAAPSGNNQIEITAQVRSNDPGVNIAAVEYFLDSTNNVINGHGFPLRATTGSFNAPFATATAILIATGQQGRQVFVHAQSADQQWSPFTVVEVPPTVNDLVAPMRTNNRLPNGK